MTDKPRLIERAFPLKQTSLDSVHEKNVRHGHISTLHIWPARRPLAACRAALIATLLPDPGSPEKRKELCEKFAGKVVEKKEKKKLPNGQIVERVTEETEGGILHWKRETENKDTLEWFRQEIRKAYGGRAPKVLDPFAGGGAIPLEAMRLGCEVTASDINPVAWFILKCTLEYPQKLAGQTRPLPDFILKNRDFMTAFFESKGLSKKDIAKELEKLGHAKTEDQHLPGMGRTDISLDADLAWHVRAWGQWVLDQARRELAPYYPTYADFEPLAEGMRSYEKQPMRLVPLNDDGTLDMDQLNGGFSDAYLRDKTNPRWVAKSTVAYLWARTVKCKNCRATIPLLKTRWLSRKGSSRATIEIKQRSDGTGVEYNVVTHASHDAVSHRTMDAHGTMTKSGVTCPCCKGIMVTDDLRLEGQYGRLGTVLTAVVVEGHGGKQYRNPTPEEQQATVVPDAQLKTAFDSVPFGLPDESVPQGGSRAGGGSPFTIHLYGMRYWRDVFTRRQLRLAATVIDQTRRSMSAVRKSGYPAPWCDALHAFLALTTDKMLDRHSALCRWDQGYTKISSTFTRFALPILWDYCEGNPFSDSTGNYLSCMEWVVETLEHCLRSLEKIPDSSVQLMSAIDNRPCEEFDAIVTDPPYYDAIPYSDLMDFFYVWLRRATHGCTPAIDHAFSAVLGPKWDKQGQNGELIDDASRFDGDLDASRQNYEDGMSRVFLACNRALNESGRLVVVFANKQPEAWETLVSAIIRAGFVVDGSWPIQTEMGNRSRAHGSSALASSVWLVCRKRAPCRPGWAKDVLKDMQSNIEQRLTEFWDAGIRGPDFVWAALGPALEAYSKYPVVKTDKPETPTMTVSEFLTHVRRIVIDFVVGRVLSGGEKSDMQMAEKLDGVTAYYLLHRNDFKMDPAPAGACILYALSCGVSDHDLAQVWGLTMSAAERKTAEDTEKADDDEGEEEESSSSGSEVRLRAWTQRKSKSLGYEAPGGREVPIIDRIHRLMHLWSEGDVQKVDAYLDDNALRRNELFRRVLQAIIELAEEGGEERSLLESISNHIQGKGAVVEDRQKNLGI